MGIAVILRDKQPFSSNLLNISRGIHPDDVLDSCQDFSQRLYSGIKRAAIFSRLAGELLVCNGRCVISYKLINQIYILVISTDNDVQKSQCQTLMSVAAILAQLVGVPSITLNGLQQSYDQVYIGVSAVLWSNYSQIEDHVNRLSGIFTQQIQQKKGQIDQAPKNIRLDMKPRGNKTLRSIEIQPRSTGYTLSQDSLQFAAQPKLTQSELPQKPQSIQMKEQVMQQGQLLAPQQNFQQLQSQQSLAQNKTGLISGFQNLDSQGPQNQTLQNQTLQNQTFASPDKLLQQQGFMQPTQQAQGIDTFGQTQQFGGQVQPQQKIKKPSLAQGAIVFRETWKGEIVRSQITKGGLVGEIRWKGEPTQDPKDIVVKATQWTFIESGIIKAADDIEPEQQDLVNKFLNFSLGSLKGGIYKKSKEAEQQVNDDFFTDEQFVKKRDNVPKFEYLIQSPVKPNPSLIQTDSASDKEIPLLKFSFPGTCVDVPAKINFDIKTRQNMQTYTYQCLVSLEISVNPDLVERVYDGIQVDLQVPKEAGKPTRIFPKGAWDSQKRVFRVKIPQVLEDVPSKVKAVFEANISKDALAQVGVFGGVASNVVANSKATIRFLCQPGPSWSGVAVYQEELGGPEELESIIGVEMTATQHKQYY